MITGSRRHPPFRTDLHRPTRGVRSSGTAPRRTAVVLTAIASLSLLGELAAQPALASPKPLASGLMSQGVQPKLFPSLVGVWNPNIYWKNIEPKPGVFRFGSIKDLIQKARANNKVLRLRIYAGRTAPKWAKNRFGTVTVYDPVDGMSAAVPRWWDKGYRHAYARLQSVLAKAFDGNPTVRAVTISEPMTIYAEPFIRGLQSRRTRHNLLASTYTKRKDKRAELGAVRAHRVWKHTRQILTINPWQYLNQDGSFGFRVRFTNKVMNACRHNFGNRCILQNNSMRSSWLTDHLPGGYHAMFAHMRKLGPPISFQTARTSRVGDLTTVLDWYLKMRAHGVELKAGAADQLTTTQAASYDAKFQANG
jgi:hypothetical protein